MLTFDMTDSKRTDPNLAVLAKLSWLTRVLGEVEEWTESRSNERSGGLVIPGRARLITPQALTLAVIREGGSAP